MLLIDVPSETSQWSRKSQVFYIAVTKTFVSIDIIHSFGLSFFKYTEDSHLGFSEIVRFSVNHREAIVAKLVLSLTLSLPVGTIRRKYDRLYSQNNKNMADTFFGKIHEVCKGTWAFLFIVLFGCWLAGQANRVGSYGYINIVLTHHRAWYSTAEHSTAEHSTTTQCSTAQHSRKQRSTAESSAAQQ